MGDKQDRRKGDHTGRKRKMPDLLVEQKAMGELPPGMEAELERLLAEDESLAERLAALEQSNRDILEQYPPGPMVAQIKRRATRATRKKTRRWGLWVGVPSLAAAAAVALLVLVPALRQDRPGPLGIYGASMGPEIVIIKGDARLKIYRRGESRMLLPGAVVRAGDDLMVHYSATRKVKYGAIVSVDGRGGVSLHLPDQVNGSTRLEPGEDQALAHSFELDDAPAFERFFFVTSAQPIDVKAVKTAIEALGKEGDRVAPRLPAGVVLQHHVLLRKRAARVTP